mmetsp:Transcript_111009/g.294987  ORF Transcript_111009/g.294987 Transcript_111009/m.294987 type:complete len:287 (+) Transcript_111009:112-972(+)
MGHSHTWDWLLWYSTFLSLLGSGCMALLCSCLTCRLGGIRRTPLFIRQLVVLATSDFLLAVWWFQQTGSLGSGRAVGGNPNDCAVFLQGLRFLQMLSVLSIVHIAAGLLAALKRRERVLQCLAKSQLVTVPCAVVLSCVFTIWKPLWDEARGYCIAQTYSDAIFSIEVSIAFLVTAAIHALASRELMRGAPEWVAARSIQRAVHYLGVFLVSWAVFVVVCFVGCAMGKGSFTQGTEDRWHNLCDMLTSMNGALNAAVYVGQNWRLLRRYSHARARRRRRRRARAWE